MTEMFLRPSKANRWPATPVPPAQTKLADLARHTLKVRADIASLCPDDLFRDYAWDILLELFVARSEGKMLCIKDLVAISRESQTSTLRRVDRLQSAGFLRRRLDPADHRRIQADLTDKGYTAMVLMLEHLYNLGEPAGHRPISHKSFVAQGVAKP